MTQTIPFPGVSDYYKAVQAPARAFTVPSLQTANFERDSLGPKLARGASAVVFQAKVGGYQQAVRCYIRNEASSWERYSALDAYLASHPLDPYVSSTMWLESAIKVNGATWPVLQMVWIDGRTLNEYVDYLVANYNTAALAMLAANWRELVKLMQSLEFAHGDLQHGNIMVDQAGTLRLVDYDGIWIPGLARMAPPTEYGHNNYQHPGLQEWGRWFDTFSALVIYLSLVALSKSPRLWQALYNSKNLLFTKADFRSPFETPTWRQLADLRDAEVDELARRLRDCCDPDWVAEMSLEKTLEGKVVPPAPPPPPPPVPEQLEWWQKLPGAPASPPPQPPSSPWPSTAASRQPTETPTAVGVQPVTLTPPGGVSIPVGGSLPAPPPLSAPLDVGTGPQRIFLAGQAPTGWWTQSRPSSAPSAPWPAAQAPPGPVAKRQVPRRSLGALAVGLSVLLLIVGAASSPENMFATVAGLVLGAVGVWLVISGSGKRGSGGTGGTGGSTGTGGTA